MPDEIALGRIEVSAQGLGCMGMSDRAGPTTWDDSVATIHRAIDLGITFIDTADIYGQGHNEVLVGRALSDRRDHVVLATKFGIDRWGKDTVLRGDRDYTRRACDASLVRLGVDVIDLYYLHRPPQNCEIEETVAAMGELVAAGKVRELGLSNVDQRLIRRAHAVHPIAAVQNEYSVWRREIEGPVIEVMRELGIALVPYCPLGHGYLTGARTTLGNQTEAGLREITGTVYQLAEQRDATPGQIALAWLYARADQLGISIVPIPGTKQVARVEENAAALHLHLDAGDLNKLEYKPDWKEAGCAIDL